MELREIAEGRATVGAVFRQELSPTGTIPSGGAITSLIDTAAMAAAWSGAEISPQPRDATVNLAVTLMAPAGEEDVEARAEVVRRGRRWSSARSRYASLGSRGGQGASDLSSVPSLPTALMTLTEKRLPVSGVTAR
jgi:uncharacterized protein (TIGR00369 family)